MIFVYNFSLGSLSRNHNDIAISCIAQGGKNCFFTIKNNGDVLIRIGNDAPSVNLIRYQTRIFTTRIITRYYNFVGKRCGYFPQLRTIFGKAIAAMTEYGNDSPSRKFPNRREKILQGERGMRKIDNDANPIIEIIRFETPGNSRCVF